MEHSKEEVCGKATKTLVRCRVLSFGEMIVKLPKYAERELYTRRKESLLVEDIYVFAFSAVNALPDKKIERCLKPQIQMDLNNSSSQLTIDSTDIEDDAQDTPNIHTLVEMYLKLKAEVKQLEEIVKEQNSKISALELEQSKKTLVESGTRYESGFKDQAEGELAQNSSESQPISSQPGDKPSKVNTFKEVLVQRQDKQNGQDIRDEGSEGAFQHTSQQRRNILKGAQGKAVPKEDIKGDSTESFKIKAAFQSASQTYLIYVGRLQRDTTTQMIREHLKDIQVRDVADVISLDNRQNRSEASFCVSVNSEASMDKMFQRSLWPVDILVRPFRSGRRSQDNQASHRSDSRESEGGHRRYHYRHEDEPCRENRYSSKRDAGHWRRDWHHGHDQNGSFGKYFRYNDYGRRY